ncbi:MAG: hypothetical protein WKG01_06690 [Kofleriaceae bacterium]
MAKLKLLFVAMLVIHGSIHLLGFVKAFGLAEVTQLTAPISRAMGVVWLIATVLLLTAAATRYVAPQWFWVVGGVALVLSQVLVISAWGDRVEAREGPTAARASSPNCLTIIG